MGAYADGDWEMFHLHLATAVEQLVKGVLACAHPALIADPTGSLDSLLHLCGLSQRARTPEWVAVRTISVTEALRRAPRIVDDYLPPPPEVITLLDSRNAIVHSGQNARQESEAILGAVARFVTPLLVAAAIDWAEYWGESSDLVADHAEMHLTDEEAMYQRQLLAARERYKTVLAMDNSARQAFLAAVEPAGSSEEFDSFPAVCPACGNLGMASGDPDPEWEADWDYGDGEAYVAGASVGHIRLRVADFRCPACQLTLDRQTLPAADMASITLDRNDYDVAHASYFFARGSDDHDY